MRRQQTIARPIRVCGAGLHTGRIGTVTLRPAPADSGIRIAIAGRAPPQSVSWRVWTPSKQSTALDLGGVMVRTIEHLMASLAAFAIDNVEIEIEGTEVPIFDGSARRWCRELRAAGIDVQAATRRVITVTRPVQVSSDGGFIRVEPAAEATLDVTHDVLMGFPVMRWHGVPTRERFEAELSDARSFGNLHRIFRLPFAPRVRPSGPVTANRPDPALQAAERRDIWREIRKREATPAFAAMPRLRGARPWRAAPILGGTVLGGARFSDEPGRHVTLDLIGDLMLAGAPLRAKIVAHNPSHVRTYALCATLMRDQDAWHLVEDRESDPQAA